MSRLDNLGEILDGYEGRAYNGGNPKNIDVNAWEELKDHMIEQGGIARLGMLSDEAKVGVCDAYKAARKLSWLRKYKGQDETYVKDLAQLLSEEEDINQIISWAIWRIGHYESAFEEFGDGEL